MQLGRTLLFCGLISAPVFGAEAPIEFRGVTVTDGVTKLSLVEKTSDTTRWVEVGKAFAGYTVKAYNAEQETVTLVKGGTELRLRLNSSQVLEAVPLFAQEIHSIRNNLRQIAAAADQYYLENGRAEVGVAELVGPEKYIKALKSIDGENYTAMSLKAGQQIFSVATQSGALVTLDQNAPNPAPDEVTFSPPMQIAAPPYVVQAGDTAAKLAKMAGLTVTELQEMNPGVDLQRLKVGQSLEVPR